MQSLLRIPRKIWNQVLDEISAHIPEEACGLLAGKGDLVSHFFPIENTLHSPTRYRMEPQQQLTAFQLIDSMDLELLAIYHSHPAGPEVPSATDIAEAYYPEVIYIIISRQEATYLQRGFTIQDQQITEISLALEE
jgi:proteasome lid subunit RPN8/RPN11